MIVKTPFRIRFFATLVSIWRKRISLRFWCRQCGRPGKLEVNFPSEYPQAICDSCGAKNVIELKWK
jgi:hypothetical protein